jgi:hypothetical protein
MFVPSTEIPQFYCRQDPRLAYKLYCTSNLCYSLSVNNCLQPAAKAPANCGTDISSPAQNINASPPTQAKEYSPNSESLATFNSQRSVLKLTRTKGQTSTQQQGTAHSRGELSSNPSDQNLLPSAETPYPIELRSVQFQGPAHVIMHQHGHQPHRQRLENSYTRH